MAQIPKKTAPIAASVKPTAQDYAKEVQSNKKWEQKERIYRLSGNDARTPFVKLQSEDRPPKKRLLHFDEEAGKQRAIRYAVNFESPYIDDQNNSGSALAPEHVVFTRGYLIVNKHEVALQRFLDVHPWNAKNPGAGPISFYEYDPEAEAKKEVDYMMHEATAISAALNADIATTEAVLRPLLGAKTNDLQTDRLTRELMLYAKKEPTQFLEDIQNDKLLLENVAYTAMDYGICTLGDNGTTLRWKDNGAKLVAIPFGNNPYKFIGDWFTTDEGLEVMNKITQKIKKQ